MNYKETIRDFFQRAWNIKEGNVAETHKIFSPTAIIDSPLGSAFGTQGMIETYKQWVYAFPDMEVFSIDLVEQNGVVVADWGCSGRHQNEFKNKVATGKKVRYDGITIYRFEGDQIVDYHCGVNLSDVYAQLGFVPQKEPARAVRGVLEGKYNLLLEKIVGLSKEEPLTEREAQLLSFLCNSYNMRETALLFAQPEADIERDLEKAFFKMGVKSSDELEAKVKQQQMHHVFKAFSKLAVAVLSRR